MEINNRDKFDVLNNEQINEVSGGRVIELGGGLSGLLFNSNPGLTVAEISKKYDITFTTPCGVSGFF